MKVLHSDLEKRPDNIVIKIDINHVPGDEIIKQDEIPDDDERESKLRSEERNLPEGKTHPEVSFNSRIFADARREIKIQNIDYFLIIEDNRDDSLLDTQKKKEREELSGF